MAESHVVTALIRKRAQLAGQIEAAQDSLRQFIIDLDNLDATLRLFCPDIQLGDIKPKPLPPQHRVYRGATARVVLQALRQASEPMTTAQLTCHVMAERGMDTTDEALARTMARRVGACLRDQRIKGLATSNQGPDGLLVWEIAR